jgi:hypothetical protein
MLDPFASLKEVRIRGAMWESRRAKLIEKEGCVYVLEDGSVILARILISFEELSRLRLELRQRPRKALRQHSGSSAQYNQDLHVFVLLLTVQT